MRQIDNLLKSSAEVTPPCVKNMRNGGLKDAHWARILLVRYMANHPYITLSPDDIALYFRFGLNKPLHNLPQNARKLVPNLRNAYGALDSPNSMTNCSKLQDPSHSHYNCTPQDRIACKRMNPLEKPLLDLEIWNMDKIHIKDDVEKNKKRFL